MTRSGGVARGGRAHGLKVNSREGKVARSCGVARGDRAGLLYWGGVFLEVARSCCCGTGWPCSFSGLTRLEFREGCVWAVLWFLCLGMCLGDGSLAKRVA